MQTHTIIIVLWKYRLNLTKLRKPGNVKLFVVGPPRTLIDETSVDVFYQVESPIRDHDHLQLLQKVRELCSMYAASQRRIVAFERSLQKAVARIRKEMSIESPVRDLRRLRQCSLSGSPQPEPWLEAVRSQVGGFPVVVRCAREKPQGILRTEREFRQWFRRTSTIHHCGEYVVQEYVEDGYEFTALCTAKGGLVACIASVETHRTILECIQSQLPYAVQLFSVEQTRDHLPGVESFVTQVIKATFAKGYTGAIFIKGFYKDHNDIFFLGFALEPESETLRSLMAISRSLTPWETMVIESHYETDENLKNGYATSPSMHHCVVNFPTAEGVLIHQTSIPRRPTSEMRVAWRCAEGQEMNDSTTIDDNVAQVYLSNMDHTNLIREAQDIMQNTDITIDRNVLLDRHSVCRRNVSRLNPRELIRSCTTTD
ncbi:unnamed protein product [Haemonchus placei]|uniref:ATP-grasp domain-containing protein n=1 Tax=Haemonchus placei TaxID=6290 RepID=A0A0N4WJS6_HAEPC|nr:unnamed protein product [Haemonchus placei]